MKKNFGTIKNIILLIASALTLVAVTFAWYTLSKSNSLNTISTGVDGSTISVKYYESTDNGSTYNLVTGDLNFNNMTEEGKRYFRMDVTSYDTPIKLIMSYDNLSSANTYAKYVYFDYRIVCTDNNNQLLANQSGLRMSDYTSSSVFSQDLETLQARGYTHFSVYYDVYLVTGSDAVSGSGSLGEVKLLGQQIG